MKLRTILTLGLAALLMTACQKDEGIDYDPMQGLSHPILIDGRINQQYLTRVDDGGFCNGDQVGLYGVNYTNDNTVAGTLLDEGNQVDNARYTYDEANLKWTASGNIYYKDAETNIDLYAYYPYGNPASTSAYQFEVQQDQSGAGVTDGYGLSDFLWAKAENVVPSEAKVKLRFSHRLACAHVVLVEGENFVEGEFDALSKSVLAMNTIRTAEIDLATGVATATGEAESEGIVMKQNSEGFRAIVVPQSVAGGKALFSITLDGITYRFKMSEGFVYEAGKQSKFTIQLNKKGHTGEVELQLINTEIVDWVADLEAHGGEARQYYVVHQEEPGTLGQLIRAAQKNPDKIKNLKVSGKIDGRDFQFMCDSMEILQAINLKETEITASWYFTVQFEGETQYHREYFEGIVPVEWSEAAAAVNARYPEKPENSIMWGGYEQANFAQEIPIFAFRDKSSLVYFEFPENITKIHAHAFWNTMLSGALIIPNDVTEIGELAFASSNISSLKLPYGLKSIGNEAFSNCASLAGELSLPETLESLGHHCFFYCGMLSGHLTIPPKITEIPSGCFSNCSGLTGLTLPEGVKNFGTDAFSYCKSMTGILDLPQSVHTIQYGAFWHCGFQGELYLPVGLKTLEGAAFGDTDFSSIVFDPEIELITLPSRLFSNMMRLSSPVVIPESVLTIGIDAFSSCRNLPSVTIPASVTTIQGGAFEGCYGLTALSCKATLPPVLGSNVFNDVPKDNFTVEVPEESVAKYQTASGWADFKRIGANHDFGIERPQMRVLNAAHEKSYLLRVPAGEPWSIESKPEWVTVTPASGVGKTEVVVSVSEMASTEAAAVTYDVWNGKAGWGTATMTGRRGEITFLLDNKDYRSTMVVEQYNSEVADGEVITNQTASVGGGVNIVFMGDCFDAKDIAEGKYLDGINEAIGYYFAIEPYKSYKEYFNIYTVVGMSPETGMGTVNTIKEAKFGSQYALDGITPNTETTYEYAMKAETVTEENLCETLVVMVENTEDYGGICYMWGDGSAIAVCPMSRDAYPFDFRGIVQHEAGGHGFAKLADEYIYTNGFVQSCSCLNPHLDSFYAGKALGWYRNLSTNGDYKTVEWAHLFMHPDYSNIVDMYEGGYFHTRGIYRSEGNSCMNNNVPYYSAIQRQEMVERIKRYAGEEFSIEEFYAKDVRDASNNDFVTRAVPENIATWSAASRQWMPKYMGEKPQLR
ncbi:MAG: hypothetical protein E7145_02545 [Rikenellaceae bacterium]|nr:hypothetical protein [Rikenellaceae bacterium]